MDPLIRKAIAKIEVVSDGQSPSIKSRNTGQSVEQVRAAFEKSVPLGRYGEPFEYGQAAAFLFSDAARYITGASLQVDGGLIKSVL